VEDIKLEKYGVEELLKDTETNDSQKKKKKQKKIMMNLILTRKSNYIQRWLHLDF